MLKITIPNTEQWDEENNVFIETKGQTIQLEHSLVSISKWESKWHKPFLNNENKTSEELLDYIKCMTITQNVDPNLYIAISQDIMKKISDYINDSMTATWFSEKDDGQSNGKIVTSEIIYYWMITLNIPVEFQKWHINRLLTLIKVCSIENSPKKKMSKKEAINRNKALNKARRQAMNSRG